MRALRFKSFSSAELSRFCHCSTTGHSLSFNKIGSIEPTDITNLFTKQKLSRFFSDSSNNQNHNIIPPPSKKRKPATTSLEATTQYRKNQLHKLRAKFAHKKPSSSVANWIYSEPLQIDEYDDVQPMWKDMESRVSKRRLPPKLSDVMQHNITQNINQMNQNGSYTNSTKVIPVGRCNIRKTDEEAWLAAGLYDQVEDNVNNYNNRTSTDQNKNDRHDDYHDNNNDREKSN